jgi:hypothetical protein
MNGKASVFYILNDYRRGNAIEDYIQQQNISNSAERLKNA